MQTTPTVAAYLEVGDMFSEQGEVYTVKSLDRDDDYMDFTVTEVATGDDYPMTFAPFDVVHIVTSLEDDEEE